MADLKNVAPLADFDWEAYEQGDNNANESREAQTEAYEGSLNKVSDHDVVDGTIISINKREVVVNIGFKSDGIMQMVGSFTILRISSMGGMVGIEFTKEQLLDMNKKLNKIKLPKKK